MAKPLTHLSPCTDIKVVNGRTITNSHSKFFKIAKKRVKQGKVVVNTQESKFGVDWYLKCCRSMFYFRRENTLSAESCELLIYIYMAFKESGSGVTSYSATKAFYPEKELGHRLQCTRKKLTTLVKHGFINKLGFSARGAHLYIPSIKAIEGLESIMQ